MPRSSNVTETSDVLVTALSLNHPQTGEDSNRGGPMSADCNPRAGIIPLGVISYPTLHACMHSGMDA